jgi:hypothetical protein
MSAPRLLQAQVCNLGTFKQHYPVNNTIMIPREVLLTNMLI